MKTYISGLIDEAVLGEIRVHPLRGNRTQAEMYEFVFQEWLSSADSRIAVHAQRLERISSELEFLRTRVDSTTDKDEILKSLEAQVQQILRSAESVEEGAQVPPHQLVGGRELDLGEEEGDFPARLVEATPRPDDSQTRRWVDLCLEVAAGYRRGRTFSDRIVGSPWDARADFFKRAFGLEPAEDILPRLSSLVGKEVLTRRKRGTGYGGGGVRMLTFYHRLPPAFKPDR